MELTKEQLVFWHKCLRKHSYDSQNEANAVIADHDDLNRLTSYQCEYCTRWHNGQFNSRDTPPTSKLRNAWKRRAVRPTPEFVVEAFKNPVESTRIFWQNK